MSCGPSWLYSDKSGTKQFVLAKTCTLIGWMLQHISHFLSSRSKFSCYIIFTSGVVIYVDSTPGRVHGARVVLQRKTHRNCFVFFGWANQNFQDDEHVVSKKKNLLQTHVYMPIRGLSLTLLFYTHALFRYDVCLL